MKAKVRTAAAAAGAALFGAAATAQGAAPVGEASATLAGLVTATDSGAPGEAEPFTWRLSASARGGVIFENQWELGAGGMLAAERDDPGRDPRGGRFGACPPAVAACPQVAGAPVRGFVSGAFPSGPAADEGVRLSLERAYLYARGGWGEVSVGRDDGVGQRFSLTPPTILAIGGGLDPLVDGTGFGGVILRNDLSGQSAKLAVTSTRIVGLQVGASWTPELEHEGLDQGYRDRALAPVAFSPEDVVELGASFAHTLSGGLDAAVGATFATAEDGAGRPAFSAMEAWSVGATLGKGPWSVGAAWLGNDNGWAAGGRDYVAWGAAGVYRAGEWSWMLEAGASRDDLPGVDVRSLTVAGRRTLGEGVAVAGGLGWREASVPVVRESSRSDREDGNLAAFVEFSLGL
ncbi:MAG: porin [Hyphomonadaceae bacterium]|nr:porin [Hyphomonadaceae bacterium]